MKSKSFIFLFQWLAIVTLYVSGPARTAKIIKDMAERMKTIEEKFGHLMTVNGVTLCFSFFLHFNVLFLLQIWLSQQTIPSSVLFYTIACRKKLIECGVNTITITCEGIKSLKYPVNEQKNPLDLNLFLNQVLYFSSTIRICSAIKACRILNEFYWIMSE